jgi:ElaB/YqjD/DUF883 family membrane-anchored ribosome-binding protein
VPNDVELKVKSQLQKVVGDLEKIAQTGAQVQETFKGIADDVEKQLKGNTEQTKTFLQNLRSSGSRIAQQLKQDFGALFSINAIQGALKISEQFKGSIRESLSLSDTIRKLGSTFGIASGHFSQFQGKLTRGLGDIGMSADVATRVLEGLASTPVRGEGSVTAYAQEAGKLASVSKQQGSEGDIAKGIAETIQARGGNVNSATEMKAIAEDLRRVFVQTGAKPTETLAAMKNIFTGMSEDFRKTLGSRALANLAAAGQVAGPNATSFMEQYLHQSKTQRAGMDARGMGGAFGANGLNTEVIEKLFKQAKALGGGDVRLGVKAATGIDNDEMAEGFIRLAESLEKVKKAQDGITKATGDLDKQYRESMGFTEAFKANINRLKGIFAPEMSNLTQGSSNMLQNASQNDYGATAVVAGGGILAALLAGGGLRGIGGGILGTVAKGGLAEAATGKDVVPVYVTNMGDGMGMGGIPGGKGKGGANGAALAGLGLGGLLSAAAILLEMGDSDPDPSTGRGQRAMLKEQAATEERVSGNQGSGPISNEQLEANTEATRRLTEAITGLSLGGVKIKAPAGLSPVGRPKPGSSY